MTYHKPMTGSVPLCPLMFSCRILNILCRTLSLVVYMMFCCNCKSLNLLNLLLLLPLFLSFSSSLFSSSSSSSSSNSFSYFIRHLMRVQLEHYSFTRGSNGFTFYFLGVFKPTIRAAVDEFHKQTCLRFVPRTNETNWIVFVDKTG